MNIIRTARMQRTSITAAAAVLMAATLSLTACGGDATGAGQTQNPSQSQGGQVGNNPTEAVYQFDQARVADDQDLGVLSMMAGSTVEVKLSDELKALVPADAPIAVESFTLTTRAFSTGMCALDIDIEYNDGGRETLEAARVDYNATELEKIRQYAKDSGFTADELKEHEEEFKSEESIARWLVSASNRSALVVDAQPTDDELEDETYITKDGSSITVVAECAEDIDDDFARLHFGAEHSDPFALVDVGVFIDGSMRLMGGVRGAEVSVSGNWVARDN